MVHAAKWNDDDFGTWGATAVCRWAMGNLTYVFVQNKFRINWNAEDGQGDGGGEASNVVNWFDARW